MDLVGERDAQDRVVVHRREMTQVAALALDPPSGRVPVDRIGASRDDRRDPRAERRAVRSSIGRPPPSSTESWSMADRLVLIAIAPVPEDEPGDHQQMRQVRGLGAGRRWCP